MGLPRVRFWLVDMFAYGGRILRVFNSVQIKCEREATHDFRPTRRTWGILKQAKSTGSLHTKQNNTKKTIKQTHYYKTEEQ